MGTLLTVLTACAGFTLTGWGALHYFRRRFDVNRRTVAGRARSVLGRRVGVAMVAAGGLLALLPDLPWAGLSEGSTRGAVAGFFSTVFWVLYRLVVLAGLGTLALSMFAVSERVTRPLSSAARRASDTVVLAMPFGPGRERRTVRRGHLGRTMPREWSDLLAHEQRLSARLLGYQRDPEAAYNRPAMHDFQEPATAEAMRAMLAADRLRTPMPPVGTRDVLLTDYGAAVLEFATALESAEANADRLVASALAPKEQAALVHAERTLAFVRGNATSAGERAAAYEQVVSALAEAAPSGEPAARTHPWLDVTERARD